MAGRHRQPASRFQPDLPAVSFYSLQTQELDEIIAVNDRVGLPSTPPPPEPPKAGPNVVRMVPKAGAVAPVTPKSDAGTVVEFAPPLPKAAPKPPTKKKVVIPADVQALIDASFAGGRDEGPDDDDDVTEELLNHYGF